MTVNLVLWYHFFTIHTSNAKYLSLYLILCIIYYCRIKERFIFCWRLRHIYCIIIIKIIFFWIWLKILRIFIITWIIIKLTNFWIIIFYIFKIRSVWLDRWKYLISIRLTIRWKFFFTRLSKILKIWLVFRSWRVKFKFIHGIIFGFWSFRIEIPVIIFFIFWVHF